jgi:hypothetical protein
MPRFLTPEWIDAVRDAAPSTGTVTVECSVVGGPEGDVKFHLAPDGVAPGGLADAAVSLTLPYADAGSIVRGELQPTVAFMQGRLKTAGDPGIVLEVLAATAREPFRDALERVAGNTEF